MKQKTIAKSIYFEGVGIHSGENVRVDMHPASKNNGIVFRRTDKDQHIKIPAICENIKSALNASTVGVNGTRIGTVEHLMAALSGMGVDNVDILVNGPEIPILDGSAAPFVKMIEETGVSELGDNRSYLVVTKPVTARRNGSFSEIRPSNCPVINCTISYDHPLLERQQMTVKVSPEDFSREVAGARTFGFLEDVDKLRALGLAKGGSLENAVILDKEDVMNEEGLRWKNEFVRHKVLDIVGDMALAGMPILGRITTFKTGHALNHLLVHKLLGNPENFDIVEERDLEEYYSDNREALAAASMS